MEETPVISEENIDSFSEKLTEFEKNIYNHELLFIKYVNNYVYLSKGVSEEHLNELADKYNKDGIVINVLNDFDAHHNEKNLKAAIGCQKNLLSFQKSFLH